MKSILTYICDTFRLIVAVIIALLIIINFLYLLPINDIPNIVPNYLIETTKDLTVSQKKAINELYLNGKLTDAQGLYGEIVEYYHFLVFLVFALLALVGGFVYLQIRHETTAKINKAIREGIAEAEIDKKIKDQIDQVDINKKIEEVINEEAVGDTVMEAVINSDDYLQQLASIVSANLEADISAIRQMADGLQEVKDGMPQLRADMESSIAGIDTTLDRLKADVQEIKDHIRGDA